MIRKKILLIGEFATPQYDKAVADAFYESGYDVFCLKEANYIEKGTLINRIEKKFKIGPNIIRLWLKLIFEINKKQYDIIYFRLCLYYPKVLIKLIKKIQKKAVLVCYMNDDPFGRQKNMIHFKNYIKNIPEFELNYVFRELNIPELTVYGSKHTKLHLPYYCKKFHFPEVYNKNDYFKYYCEAIYIGHGENDFRLDCFDYLLENNIDFRLGGGNFSQFAKGRLFNKLLPVKYYNIEDYRKAIFYANCSICFFSSYNRDIITTRVFEIVACKGLLLCQKSPLVESIFIEGKEALYFSNKEELLEKVLFLKNNVKLRNSIAEAGYKKLLKTRNEVTDRVQMIIKDINLL